MIESTLLRLTKAQDKKLGDLAALSCQVLAYYWGAGVLRVIPVPQKQADEFAKLLQRYKEEQEQAEGHETQAWRAIHDE